MHKNNLDQAQHETALMPFLATMQRWLNDCFPTRQFSSTDIFYLFQWARSGIPAAEFMAGFNDFLARHPGFFDKSFRLSRLKYEAERIIAKQIKCRTQAIHEPLSIVNDPYQPLLEAVTHCGRSLANPMLRDILRQAFRDLKHAQTQAEHRLSQWRTLAEDYYAFKAQAMMDWQSVLQKIGDACLACLTPQEMETITALSAREKVHAMQLGHEAAQHYQKARAREKLAQYFDLSSLFEIN